jgi:hypothetical protein
MAAGDHPAPTKRMILPINRLVTDVVWMSNDLEPDELAQPDRGGTQTTRRSFGPCIARAAASAIEI